MRILHVVTAFPRMPDDVIVPWLVELLKRLQAPGRARSVVRRDSGASVPVLCRAVGEPDSRRSGPRPDEALPPVSLHAGLVRARRHGGDLAAVPPYPLRRHPRALA